MVKNPFENACVSACVRVCVRVCVLYVFTLNIRVTKLFIIYFRCLLFVLRFYGPVNPIGSCRARSVYLTTYFLGRLSPLSG